MNFILTLLFLWHWNFLLPLGFLFPWNFLLPLGFLFLWNFLLPLGWNFLLLFQRLDMEVVAALGALSRQWLARTACKSKHIRNLWSRPCQVDIAEGPKGPSKRQHG
jgi:hypothetical protein